MRIVIQRVSHASVTIDGVCKSAIEKGLMILVGIEEADNQEDADWLCKKVIGLRVFDDENGVMNKSILEDGDLLSFCRASLYLPVRRILQCRLISASLFQWKTCTVLRWLLMRGLLVVQLFSLIFSLFY